jgi:hypothetical protein
MDAPPRRVPRRISNAPTDGAMDRRGAPPFQDGRAGTWPPPIGSRFGWTQ